jgi:probable HAF family extracellular repeat protein
MKSSGLCSGGEASFRSSPRVPNRVLRESLKKIDPVTTDSVPVLPRYEEADMRSSTLICMITGVAVLMALALPFQLAAQQTRYKIIDLGPLGGPNSYQTFPAQSLNNRGEIIAFADTAVPDPYAPICLQTDCFVAHALRVEGGVLKDLGTPVDVDSTMNGSVPTWISETGLVAGLSENGSIDPLTGFPQLRAVLWNTDGIGIDLGTLGGNFSQAFGVNSRGQVVGMALNSIPDSLAQTMFIAATQVRAFLWQGGSMRDLGTLGGTDAQALVVNERGQVVGFSFTDSSLNATTGTPTVHPFLFEDGKMLDLHSLGGSFAVPGPLFAQGGGVLNNRGQVVGASTLEGDQTWHPFLWEGGVLKDLGTLGGNNGEAFWLSDSGLVVGRADFSPESTHHHAFLWKNGAMTDLGTLEPCLNSTAVSVNSKGQVVGETGACPSGGDGPIFLSENGEPMVDLNTLVLPGSDLFLIGAANINDRGEIAGLGVLPNGDTRGVVLVPASAAEIAAASPLATAKPTTVPPHRAAPTSVDSPFGGRMMRRNLFRRLQPEP